MPKKLKKRFGMILVMKTILIVMKTKLNCMSWWAKTKVASLKIYVSGTRSNMGLAEKGLLNSQAIMYGHHMTTLYPFCSLCFSYPVRQQHTPMRK